MVKIINGEIIQDNDPRLQQRQQTHTHGPRQDIAEASTGRQSTPAASATGPGGGVGFNTSAPPLRFVPPAPGIEPFFGLPDAEVFGVRISVYAVLAAISLGFFFGWRGLVVVTILSYVYLASRNNAPAQPGAQPLQAPRTATEGQTQQPAQQEQQQPQGNMAMDALQRYMEGPKPRSRTAGTASTGDGGASAPGVDGAERLQRSGGAGGASSNWAAFEGRGNKLGSK